MPRYIDVEGYRKLFDAEYKKTRELINQGETHLDNLAEGFTEAGRVIDRIPTADVVPNVELEAMRGAANSYKMHYEKTKNELAREIFEEIEKLVALKMPAKITPIFKRDLDYSHGVIDGQRDAVFGILVLIAGLKEKYSKRYFKEDGEDTNVPTKVSLSDICVVCGEPVPEGRQICSMCETGQEFLNKKKG